MWIKVLGSAAGGRFPQWNCACHNCEGVRAGTVRAQPRTQDSLAVSADGAHWFLFNASPDILQQIEATPALHPEERRGTPITGIFLTNGDLDHVLGLLSLRESTPHVVFATEAVRAGLMRNPMLRTLQRFEGQLRFRRLVPGEPIHLTAEGASNGLLVTPFAVRGKLPIHLAGESASLEDNVGFSIRDLRNRTRCVYAPAVGSLNAVREELRKPADYLLLDGTFFTSDELVREGVGRAKAEDMAHVPISGPDGSLAALEHLPVRRKIYTHVNNTNPILREDADERARIAQAGWEVAFDGMELCP